ncbi:MAG: alpha/beta hydrolase [Pseudomonadota bacterium]
MRLCALLGFAVLSGGLEIASADTVSERVVSFDSRNTTLEGTLVLPGQLPPVAAVVFVHGSGAQPRNLAVGHAFARRGVAALVYDKRGVGNSGGDYEGDQPVSEANLTLLAADARAALARLSEERELQGVPLGLTGISQAGWIVPLAAFGSDVDFLALWSGPVCAISEEDIFSKYTHDLDAGRVPAYAEALAARTTPYVWPDFLGRDTDASEDLARLDLPGVWLFGENDGSVPVDLSIERLRALQDAGHDYHYVLFSGVGHNNMPETFDTAVAWIKRTISRQRAEPSSAQ